MALTRDQILGQIDDVLESVSDFSAGRLAGGVAGTAEVTLLGAAIERLSPSPSMYRASANRILGMGYDKFTVEPLAQVLRALREDVEKGYTLAVGFGEVVGQHQ